MITTAGVIIAQRVTNCDLDAPFIPVTIPNPSTPHCKAMIVSADLYELPPVKVLIFFDSGHGE
jgi:hypothetical protein